MKKKQKDLLCRVKTEFSKLFCVLVALAIGAYGVWTGIRYYQLTEMAIQLSGGAYTVMPPTDLAVVCVSGILVSLLSYLAYNGFLKNSLNKNKLSINDCTGKVSSILDNNVKDIIIDMIDEDLNTNNEQPAG